jgi:hypothetical protein
MHAAKSKYGAIKTNGYASKKESARAHELKILQRVGDIQNLREQVEFVLLPAQEKDDGSKERSVKYIADFVYEFNGKQVVEDCKGFRTSDYILKRKMMLHFYGITIKET